MRQIGVKMWINKNVLGLARINFNNNHTYFCYRDIVKKMQLRMIIYGVIISTGCGVVTLQGFLMAFVGEVFRVCAMGLNENSFGFVVNLYRDDTMNLLIGALLLNPENRVSEGAKVNGMSRLASIILGDFAIGSILDPVGNFILNSGRIDVQYRWVVESPAPGIIDRQSVFEPLQTGVISFHLWFYSYSSYIINPNIFLLTALTSLTQIFYKRQNYYR
jgi:F0F1-type ATP synthase alpha subunit